MFCREQSDCRAPVSDRPRRASGAGTLAGTDVPAGDYYSVVILRTRHRTRSGTGSVQIHPDTLWSVKSACGAYFYRLLRAAWYTLLLLHVQGACNESDSSREEQVVRA